MQGLIARLLAQVSDQFSNPCTDAVTPFVPLMSPRSIGVPPINWCPVSGDGLISHVRSLGGFHRHGKLVWLAMVVSSSIQPQMSTEVRNWDIVAKAMEAAGATSSQMYVRAKALALGKLDPMPTSSPEAPYSISAVAG